MDNWSQWFVDLGHFNGLGDTVVQLTRGTNWSQLYVDPGYGGDYQDDFCGSQLAQVVCCSLVKTSCPCLTFPVGQGIRG